MSLLRYRSVNPGTIYKVEKSILTLTVVENGVSRIASPDEAAVLLANWAKDRADAPGFAIRMNKAIDELQAEIEDINKAGVTDDDDDKDKEAPPRTKIFTAKCGPDGVVNTDYQRTYLQNYADSVLYGIFPSPRDSFKLKGGKAVLMARELVYTKTSRGGYALPEGAPTISEAVEEIMNEVHVLYPEDVQTEWYDAVWKRMDPQIVESTYDPACLMLTMRKKVVATFKRPVNTEIEVPKTYSKWEKA